MCRVKLQKPLMMCIHRIQPYDRLMAGLMSRDKAIHVVIALKRGTETVKQNMTKRWQDSVNSNQIKWVTMTWMLNVFTHTQTNSEILPHPLISNACTHMYTLTHIHLYMLRPSNGILITRLMFLCFHESFLSANTSFPYM